jgi:bifunctional DNA-binding transcriptional regulator/antitoxin component of YhaV-PrlF toxin-antitoxin module
MALVEVDDRHRLTIPRGVRERFRIMRGQKFYLVPAGDELILKPIPEDPSKQLSNLIGNFRFDRRARRKAEKWLIKEMRNSSTKKKSQF